MGFEKPVAQDTYGHFEENHIHEIVHSREIVAQPAQGDPITFVLDTTDLDANNNFSVKIQNIGNKPWTGKMSIKVKDQYNKSIESSKVQVPTLAPGAVTDVSLPIYVPKEDPITRYNMGTSLSTYIKFYLSTES